MRDLDPAGTGVWCMMRVASVGVRLVRRSFSFTLGVTVYLIAIAPGLFGRYPSISVRRVSGDSSL